MTFGVTRAEMFYLRRIGLSLTRCPRCDGLLYSEPVPDGHDAHTQIVCFNCGERLDSLILNNRRLSPQPPTGLRNARRFPRLIRRIYALVDPESEQVRYVGNTGVSFRLRLSRMYTKYPDKLAEQQGQICGNEHLYDWLHYLRGKGLAPRMIQRHKTSSNLG